MTWAHGELALPIDLLNVRFQSIAGIRVVLLLRRNNFD